MKDYILNLRKEVGNRPLVISGVVGLIIDNDQILLVNRNDNEFWGMPAGSIELYESPQTAVCREIFEETGLKVLESDLKLLNTFGGENFSYVYPNGDQCSFVSISFLIKSFTGKILRETNETIDCRFFPLDQLPKNIAQHEKLVIEDYLSGRKK